MSYIVKGLPEIETLKKQLEEDKWVNYYRKYGGFTGSSKAIKFLMKVLNKKSSS